MPVGNISYFIPTNKSICSTISIKKCFEHVASFAALLLSLEIFINERV
jgi:hypothetical protein